MEGDKETGQEGKATAAALVPGTAAGTCGVCDKYVNNLVTQEHWQVCPQEDQ